MTKPPVDIHEISILISSQDIVARVTTLGRQIASELPHDLMIVALLRGSFVFAADLIRALHNAGSQPQVDFLTLVSYGKDMISSGTVQIVRDMVEPVAGRDVLIVDDILESGRTLTFARNLLVERGVRSVKVAVLLEKSGKRVTDVKADYVGFSVGDQFVVGYGLDYANYYRELPFIGAIPKPAS